MGGDMRILQTANVMTPVASGDVTALRALAMGYRAAGHSVIRVVPGVEDRRDSDGDAEIITVAARRVPGTGYRMITSARRMLRLLDEIRPDRIEVSDRFTPQAVGRWAHRHGVPTVAISHQRLDAVLATSVRSPWLARFLADLWNLRLVVSFDTIVCATDWAGEEFARLGAENMVKVRPGVDLATFHPRRASARVRGELTADDQPLLMMAEPLVPETHPQLAIDTVRALHDQGLHARLAVIGSGPLLQACRRRARDLPVAFLGDVPDRQHLARLLATADVVLAPGATGTFGLTALEALACGTPVVGHRGGALRELIDVAAGAVTDGHPAAFAEAVMRLLSMDEACRSAAARAHAERFGWPVTVEQMLAVHGAEVPQAA
jgi:alpha-1,6-mannosyltransferase